MKKALKVFKNEYIDFKNDLAKKKIRSSLVALFFSILGVICYGNRYALLITSFMTLIMSLRALSKKQRFGYISLLIMLVTAGLSIHSYFTYDRYMVDPNEGKNILIGKWKYNDSGGIYEFKKDKTYIQYINEETSDNYCSGVYKYSYSFETDDGKIITKDLDFTYYSITLTAKECHIATRDEEATKYSKHMVFGLNLFDAENSSVIVNTNTNKYSILKKIK